MSCQVAPPNQRKRQPLRFRRQSAAGGTSPEAGAWVVSLPFSAHELRREVEAWVPGEHLRRTHIVTNTRWWPPFCAVVDWVATAVLVVLIAAGVTSHA